jgi:hypothetical protein
LNFKVDFDNIESMQNKVHVMLRALENFLYEDQLRVLCAGVEGPCLHRPGNWLVRQLIDEPKPVYKVGFIKEKGKAATTEK